MKNIITQMKNTLEGINSRLGEADDHINDLENKIAENIQTEQPKEKKKKLEQCEEPLEQHQAYQHSHHRGPRRRREQEIENVFEEIMTKNFPNLEK